MTKSIFRVSQTRSLKQHAFLFDRYTSVGELRLVELLIVSLVYNALTIQVFDN